MEVLLLKQYYSNTAFIFKNVRDEVGLCDLFFFLVSLQIIKYQFLLSGVWE